MLLVASNPLISSKSKCGESRLRVTFPELGQEPRMVMISLMGELLWMLPCVCAHGLSAASDKSLLQIK